MEPHPKQHPKQLLVEGNDDAYAVVGLMQHHVPWGDSREQWPVWIRETGGVDQLLHEDTLAAYLQQPGLQALGICVDANEKLDSRWARCRQLCEALRVPAPAAPPAGGLIEAVPDGPRVGIWLMPDNRSAGMLETFLTYLVPGGSDALWAYAQEAARQARKFGATYADAHRDKADIHTWLAWQAPPGRPFGEALKRAILDPRSQRAKPFVDWFIELFGLDGL